MALSLEDFVAAEIRHIERFAEYWRAGNADKPEDFPMSMDDGNEGAWSEQLACFQQGQHTKAT